MECLVRGGRNITVAKEKDHVVPRKLAGGTFQVLGASRLAAAIDVARAAGVADATLAAAQAKLDSANAAAAEPKRSKSLFPGKKAAKGTAAEKDTAGAQNGGKGGGGKQNKRHAGARCTR